MKVAVQYFFDNPAPEPYEGWTLPAFQEYCREHLPKHGFNLTKPFAYSYDVKKREIVFYQDIGLSAKPLNN